MLIKEYKIPLPLTVDEYRIAQLYMIAKKSREETKGVGSGVEILINEPYEEGPGGSGQYTKKIYHVGSHLPGWFKSLLPKSALTVEEEAWNAYPYTKTRYTCPFVQRFSLEIETCYCADEGHQENIFNLKGSDLKERGVDVIDFVKDQLHGTDYLMEEDPRIYMSEKTGRGPLNENWVQEYWAECKNKPMPNHEGKAIMCAYKLCRVEFHYWGMQSKIEKFIHDVALRKTMLRAHRQAWAWQDEWHGLTMDDIREIEKQTAEALKKKMAASEDDDENDGESDNEGDKKEEDGLFCNSNFPSSNVNDISLSPSASTNSFAAASTSQPQQVESKQTNISSDILVEKPIKVQISDLTVTGEETANKTRRYSTKISSNLHSSPRPSKNYDMLTSWRMESIVRKDSDVDDSEDEFFDCLEKDEDALSLTKWSSVERIPHENDSANEESKDDSIFNEKFLEKVTVGRQNSQRSFTRGISESRGSYDVNTCKTSTLCLIVHAGCALDAAMDLTAKKSDVTTFKGAFECVVRQHYSSMIGRIVIKLVPCPSICTDALGILSSLSPYSFDRFTSGESPCILHESVSIGAIPLISASQPEYTDAVLKTVLSANQVYQEFLKSEDGHGFNGQVIVIGDSMGSLLAYDALTRHSHSGQYANEDDIPPSPVHGGDGEHLQVTYDPLTSARRRSSSSNSESGANTKLDFDVSDFFTFGSPLSLVLAHRKVHSEDRQMHLTRPCHQVYNLFHPTDPLAARLEPILSARFAAISPVNVSKYSRYPLGDGQTSQLLECIRFNSHVFESSHEPMTPNSSRRRSSDISMQSLMSGLDVLPLQSANQLQQKWWGSKRLDYALYCPEGLAAFPVHSLPHLFHASYWESTDAIAFILQQIGFQETETTKSRDSTGDRLFIPGQPREKWIKKRTSVKLKNVAPNHRANDVIVGEGNPVTLKARFMYGPLDMVGLTGEKVDIYIMKDPPSGDWTLLASEFTDKHGRIAYTLSSEVTPAYGMYPIKMIVRGDHTFADLYCAILPPKTECVVFSIDGSFTASMSVTGRDPRVRAGAVDVVRHWHELGYLIIYVTGRPDMQHHKVVAWLVQHNFPHGLVYFEDGLSTEFLGHKTEYLRSLVQDHKISIHAAYGSCKDITVYSSIGIPPEKIYIVGKSQKKQQSHATILSDGYSVHLSTLQALGGSRPAKGNALMVIPRGCFGFSGQPCSIQRRRSARRTTSFPTTGQQPRRENFPSLSLRSPGHLTKDDNSDKGMK